MKTLAYIGVAVVVSGAALLFYINWSINRLVVGPGPKTCPVWLADTPQDGC